MEKKQKKTPLIVPILWFITTALWSANLVMRLSSPYTATETIVLTALAALASLAAALAHLRRYKRDKDDPDKV